MPDDHMLEPTADDLDDIHTEGGDDGMEYGQMDEDEQAEQDAALRMHEDLKQKRLVGDV
jgi:hypothetical protein